ncbi:uncharacterized protein K489DRAFT_367980 [Dissoconium aciculare CBS 342.82]|uniref:F-box domain-containing protein n=1 Tax=Dissoconium aciculare CBS 342.82 TaxID=1314786 RepID=A0A6J3MFM5_9PEZI|nr:uncharacterized protein K489DRAFT_367980 [Dissoconium aciculare CBS 342.82]KAF1826806.1 hypothetical protein K489DRAFT_367980 [Dissoconium aciculare CBS 342.82]
MTGLMDLPVEILTIIFHQLQDIRTVLSLSATCSELQQIWRRSTTSITSAALPFTHDHLLAFLELAKLEAATTHGKTSLTSSSSREKGEEDNDDDDDVDDDDDDDDDDLDLNASMRKFLSSIEPSAFAITTILQAWASQAIYEVNPRVLLGYQSTMGYLYWEDGNLADGCGPIPDFHDCARHFLLLRRLSAAYEHPLTRPAVYADLHGLSPAAFDIFYRVVKFFEDDSLAPHYPRMGIGPVEDEPTWKSWDHLRVEPSESVLPMAWDFAVHVAVLESLWRPVTDDSPFEESFLLEAWEGFVVEFGRKCARLLFGDAGIPWTEERRAAARRRS